jgi:hypothetical protein
VAGETACAAWIAGVRRRNNLCHLRLLLVCVLAIAFVPAIASTLPWALDC